MLIAVAIIVPVAVLTVLSLAMFFRSRRDPQTANYLLAVSNLLLTAVLVVAGVFGLATWRHERDFAIARDLYLTLFELDREAVEVRGSLDMGILLNIERFGNAEPLQSIDYNFQFDRVLQSCKRFQSALVEAAARWSTDFGLGPIGAISTYAIEFAITRMIEFGIDLDRRDPYALDDDDRVEIAAGLRQEFLQLGRETRATLQEQREIFYAAIRPMVEKHFISSGLLE